MEGFLLIFFSTMNKTGAQNKNTEYASDGYSITIHQLPIDLDVRRAIDEIFSYIQKDARYADTTPNVLVVCNGHENTYQSPQDLAELFQGLNVPSKQAIRALMGYWASACARIVLETQGIGTRPELLGQGA